jgi:hypothetical protein
VRPISSCTSSSETHRAVLELLTSLERGDEVAFRVAGPIHDG